MELIRFWRDSTDGGHADIAVKPCEGGANGQEEEEDWHESDSLGVREEIASGFDDADGNSETVEVASEAQAVNAR